ncbi:MAG: OB-fold nucleic acid binding domain-containing protein [Verrucomicrobiales bacterium]|nr:OB-fold nucleic acid binding domain-containing protein [Verrucomicrobiales bacterium]
MEDTNSLIEQRKAKLAALRAKGIDPFQNKFTPTETCKQARDNYVESREVALAGRITAHRDMGKSMFIDIRDQSGRIQAYAQKNVLGDEQFHIFQHLDLGDFIGVKGTMFTTKTGEISVKIGGVAAAPSQPSGDGASPLPPFVILAKALRPPPAKYYGLEDTEIRYRQRYLDLIANPDVKDVMLKRSAIIHEIRNFFHERNYVEVETPAMQAIPGGAAAQPFKTFHNALGCEFYLRIALELYHKRLLVGGIDKLFEIGKNFRNEGLSRRHNPEFTMLEAYCAFGDYATMMETVESLITTVAQKVLGSLVIEHPLKCRFKKELNNSIIKLKYLHKKLIEDFNKSLINSDVTTEAYLDFNTVFSASMRELELLSHPNNKTPLNQAIQQARKSFINCSMEGNFFRLSPGMEVTKKEVDGYTEEFVSFITQILPQFDSLKNEAGAIPPESLNKVIDLTTWRRAKYNDLVTEKAGANWFTLSAAERRQKAHDMGAEIGKEFEDFEVTNAVFSKFIEPTLIQPTFVTHLPKELVPLAKLSPDDPTTVEVFECCINGQEISPGYTEQNDPIAQRTTLEHQAGGEQQKLDEDFLVALEHGMPPAGGIGIGIDRLCMMLLGQESIRDVILFPQLKPK